MAGSGVLREAERLAAGRDLARLIADNAASGLFLMDERGVATYCNPAAVAMTGWTVEAMEGRTLHDCVHHTRPDGTPFPIAECPIVRTLASGERLRDHADVFIRRDGTPFPVVCAATPIMEGGRWVGAVLEVRDASAEHQAAERAARLHAVTASLSGAPTRDALAGVIVGQGVAALGARAGSLALLADGGREIEVVRGIGYAPEQLAAYRRIDLDANFPLAEAMRTGEPILLRDDEERDRRYPNLATLRRANGGGAMAAVPVFADGRVAGAIGLNFAEARAFDAAERGFLLSLAAQCGQALERVRLYEAERRARAEAERANQAKVDFLATMSHELRTPLNAIGGYAELLALGVHGPLTPAQADDVGRVQANTRQLLGLINDLLHFAKLDAGHVEYAIAPVRLAEAFAAADAAIAPLAQARGVTFATLPCDPGLGVRADADKLRQVLVNLVSNAVKFTEPGGRVALAADADASLVRVTVRDTGIGIPADRLEAVFDPFVQLDSSLTRATPGTGLGLAISRDLARGMGGVLSVESRVGEGSTFTLTLPRA